MIGRAAEYETLEAFERQFEQTAANDLMPVPLKKLLMDRALDGMLSAVSQTAQKSPQLASEMAEFVVDFLEFWAPEHLTQAFKAPISEERVSVRSHASDVYNVVAPMREELALTHSK